jgi:parallel beta-helix repeat protein
MLFLRPLFRGTGRISRNITQRAPRKTGYRPLLETLEDRLVPSAVLLVDDDHAQAPNAQYTSINAAVAAAQPGDTIRVYSGTYHESVNVDKTLTFQAVPKAGPVIVDPGTLGSGFNVQANDVKILGFTVQDAVGNPGINLSRTVSGADLEHNVLRDNTFGVYLNSSGTDRTVLRENQFLHNNAAGAASGNGIYSDQGVTNARIVDNFFTGQQNAAMIFVGNGTAAQAQSNLTIRGNTLNHDAPIIVVNASDSTISDNVSIGSSGSGIFFGGGVHDVVVSHNTLRDGAFTGINLRMDSANYPVSTPDTNNVIRDNIITGFGDSGIRLRDGASGNLVVDNTISGNGTGNDPTTGDGISLEAATGNVIRDNNVTRNRRDGIRVDAASTGNRIIDNRLRHNGEFDARDDSTGTGTAGTANIWKDNTGATQNRPGLLDTHGHDHDHDGDEAHHRGRPDHDRVREGRDD